jgi:hypothetical protein
MLHGIFCSSLFVIHSPTLHTYDSRYDTVYRKQTSYHLRSVKLSSVNAMKLVIVVLVLGALLLHVASVNAFQQSSSGSLNILTRTFSKSTPMHGYLDSLGNTAAAFKAEASPAYLPPRYEAEYPRRHDFSNVDVFTSPSEPVASNIQQSDPVSQQSSSNAYIGTSTGTSGTSVYQYGQSTSPSELLGNAFMNMMGEVPSSPSIGR